MFGCQGNCEQYDTTERKKQLVFGIKKTKQNKILNRPIIVFIGRDVFHANDSSISTGNRGSVADASGAAVKPVYSLPCLTVVYLQLSKPCLETNKNPVIKSYHCKAMGFSLASLLLTKMVLLR